MVTLFTFTTFFSGFSPFVQFFQTSSTSPFLRPYEAFRGLLRRIRLSPPSPSLDMARQVRLTLMGKFLLSVSQTPLSVSRGSFNLIGFGLEPECQFPSLMVLKILGVDAN